MRTIGKYNLTELLYKSEKTVVYRGEIEDSESSVIIKTVELDLPSPKMVSVLQNEFNLLQGFAGTEGIIQAIGFEVIDGQPVLILEDFGGVPLGKFLEEGQLSLEKKLDLALSVVGCIRAIHERRIIHYDIKPDNILIRPDATGVKICDFDLSREFDLETQEYQVARQLEGTLSYLSPEQTGRMNRRTDYRTDFYSFGILLYELLSGRVPFISEDPMELIYCHLAQAPADLTEINPGIPKVLSSIVMKLLEKSAEERYQSAYGLSHDLRRCLRSLEVGGKIPEFPIAEKDVHKVFGLAQNLYGRESEVEALLDRFDEVASAGCGIVLVAGYSGVGKTALVNEIQKPVAAKRGLFVRGKYDQFQRSVPFSGLAQAFHGLISQILSEREEVVQSYRQAITEKLGSDAYLLCEVLPGLDALLGKQKKPPDSQSDQAQETVRRSFLHLIRLFARPEHPLVMVLDDLQWVDLASLKLIEYLMAEAQDANLMLIGLYRDNEVSASHPLMMAMADLENEGARIETLTLKPLALDHVLHWIGDSIRLPDAERKELARLVYEKTGGNPFFASELLKSLSQLRLIYFDEGQGTFRVDLEGVSGKGFTENVVEFMMEKIQDFGADTREVLMIASGIGGRFNLALVSKLAAGNLGNTVRSLWPAVRAGLLLVPSRIYPILKGLLDSDKVQDPELARRIVLQFGHDRIQQAAYSFLRDADRAEFHLRLGRAMLPDTSEDLLFEVVGHLNRGAELITDESERLELARSNLKVAIKAKDSSAFDSARSYCQEGIRCLPSDSWNARFELTRDLKLNLAECCYILGSHDEAEAIYDEILKHSRTTLDKARVYRRKIALYNTSGRLSDAMDAGLTALSLFGYKMRRKPSLVPVMTALLQARWGLRKFKRTEDLMHLPDASDETALTLLDLMFSLYAPTFLGDQNLFAWLALQSFRISLRFGNSMYASAAYGAYGILLLTALGNRKGGIEFIRLAHRLNQKYPSSSILGLMTFVVGHFASFWDEPIHRSLLYVKDGYRYSIASGNVVYGSSSAQSYLTYLVIFGAPAAELAAKVEEVLSIASIADDPEIKMQRQIFGSYSRCLLGKTDSSTDFSDGEISEKEITRQIPHLPSPQMWMDFGMTKLMVCYVFRNAPPVEIIREALRVCREFSWSYQAIIICFYHGMHAAEIAKRSRDRREKAQNIGVLKKAWKNLSSCSSFYPENFANKELMLRAELKLLEGDTGSATYLYQQAALRSEKARLYAESAIAYENLMLLCLSPETEGDPGSLKLAGFYYKEALRWYSYWGVTRKVRALTEEYGYLVEEISASRSSISKASSRTSQAMYSKVLDVMTLMKSFQAISEEIFLDRLLKRLIQIMVENAGATRGVLCFEENGSFFIQAELNQEAVRVLQVEPLTESTVPLSLIQYVKRTHESVVLNHSKGDELFGKDPYIQRNEVKSVLCMPVIQQGKLNSILYLENNRVKGAFTQERFETLKLLCAQAAISLRNSEIYADMVAKLNNIGSKISTLSDVDRLAGALREIIASILEVECVTLYLYDFESEQLVLRLGEGISDEMKTKAQGAALNSLPGHVFRNRAVISIADLSRNSEGLKLEPFHSKQFNSVLYLPVMNREDCVGAVGLHSHAKDHFTEEHKALLSYVAHLAGVVYQNIVDNNRLEKERQRAIQLDLQKAVLEKDLELTGVVQSLLLPKERFSIGKGASLAGFFRSADQSGGDWWHYHHFENGTLLLLGDVTGHGAGSAMITSAIASCYQMFIKEAPARLQEKDVEGLLQSFNYCLLHVGGGEYWMSFSVLFFEEQNAALSWWSAGAPPLLILRKSSAAVQAYNNPAHLLGFKQVIHPPKMDFPLSPGDRILVSSDGFYEEAAQDGRKLGIRGLGRYLQEVKSMPLQEAAATLGAKYQQMLGDRKPKDDNTFVVVDRP